MSCLKWDLQYDLLVDQALLRRMGRVISSSVRIFTSNITFSIIKMHRIHQDAPRISFDSTGLARQGISARPRSYSLLLPIVRSNIRVTRL